MSAESGLISHREGDQSGGGVAADRDEDRLAVGGSPHVGGQVGAQLADTDLSRARIGREHVYASVHTPICVMSTAHARFAPMNFAFTEEQDELRKTVRQFLDAKSPESAVREQMETESGFDPAVWAQMGEQMG